MQSLKKNMRQEGMRDTKKLTHLFVHFNVKAVGHLVILKHRGEHQLI